MKGIISFDLWGTLIRSNPGYKDALIEEYSKINTVFEDKEKMRECLTIQKKHFDSFDELTGIHSSFDARVNFILSFFGDSVDTQQFEDTKLKMINIISKVCEKYPPLPYDDDTIECIKRLKAQGYDLRIISNTSMLGSLQLKKVIEDTFGKDTFTNMIFSDVIGFAKPNRNTFWSCIKDCKKDIPKWHVGDNEKADGGCIKMGYTFLHVNKEGKRSIKSVLEYFIPTVDEIISPYFIKKTIPFSKTAYSKFKFGSKKEAKEMGRILAYNFIARIKETPELFRDRKIVVISSPYQFIPTATFAMKDYFIKYLNTWLAESDMDVVEETKITRTISYSEDYGALSAEDRMKLISKDKFHIDKEFVKDKICLFLDDIRITGSHEVLVKKMINEYKLQSINFFLYYAVLDNPNIDPSIENELNYAYVKSLTDLNKIIRNEWFILNTRTTKYILSQDTEEFKNFISYQSNAFIENLYCQALGNEYHKKAEYMANLKIIRESYISQIV